MIEEIIEALKINEEDYGVKQYPLTLSKQEQKILLEYIEELQQKIDKAIEYIKHNQNNREGLSITEYHKNWIELYDYYESKSIMKDLLEILGGNNE